MRGVYGSYTIILLAAGFMLVLGSDFVVTGMITGERPGDVSGANFWGVILISCGLLSFFMWKAELQRRGVDPKSALGKELLKTELPRYSPTRGIEQEVLNFAQNHTGEAYLYGSTTRDTQVPDNYDIDVYSPRSPSSLTDTVNTIESNRGELERRIGNAYGKPVDMVQKVAKTKDDPGLNQVFYEVQDRDTGEKIVKVDFNYSTEERPEMYNMAFNRQMYDIIKDLPQADQQFAIDYIKGNIRTVKKLMGGVTPGILAEQMVMGGVDSSYTTINQVLKDFSAGNAMARMQGTRYVPHPVSGDNLVSSYDDLQSRIKDHKKYMFRPRSMVDKTTEYIKEKAGQVKQTIGDYISLKPSYGN